MNRIGIAFVIALIGVSAIPIEENKPPRFIEFPDPDGVYHLIDLENEDPTPHKFDPDRDVRFLLFNRENPDTPVEFLKGDAETLLGANFDPSKPVKITIHGWGGNGFSGMSILLKNAFLNEMDVSIISIDWKVAASADYIRAVRYVPLVGNKVGEMIDWLNTLGVSFSNVHILGHSLGGHVAGISGRSATTGEVEYITGLDPAYPLWGKDSQRIRSSDGKYVEIIHTNGGQLGLMEPVGDVDFYPNGGVNMEGCLIIDPGCSHGRSVSYIADSIDHKGFMANKCESVEEISNGNCSNIGQLHMGGADIKPEYEGVYYLTTNAKKPYYQG